MCAKNKNICMWPEQAIIESSRRRVISIVACCRGAKLCAHAAQDFRSQQYEAHLLIVYLLFSEKKVTKILWKKDFLEKNLVN